MRHSRQTLDVASNVILPNALAAELVIILTELSSRTLHALQPMAAACARSCFRQVHDASDVARPALAERRPDRWHGIASYRRRLRPVNVFLPWRRPLNGNARWVIGVLGSIAGLAVGGIVNTEVRRVPGNASSVSGSRWNVVGGIAACR